VRRRGPMQTRGGDGPLVRGKRPWCARARFDDERLRTMAPRAWPGANGLPAAMLWVLLPSALLALGSMSMIALHGFGVYRVSRGYADALAVLFALGAFSATVAGTAMFATGVPRVERRVVAARGRLCPWCAHSLAGRRPAERRTELACPECGAGVRLRDAVLFWLRQVRRAHDP